MTRDDAHGESEVPVLAYAGRTDRQRPRAPAWVWVLAAVYLLMLAAMAGVPWLLAYSEDFRFREYTPITALVAVLLVAEFALLIVPVRVASHRPVTRTPYWTALVAGSLLGGVLVAGLVFGLSELFASDKSEPGWWTLAIVLVGWAAWFVVFAAIRKPDGAGPADRLHRYLLAGSIVELLVAVPVHIVVKNRRSCCAGLATGTAIVTGVVVMLLAFGPSIALLFYRRWKGRTAGPRDVMPRQDER